MANAPLPQYRPSFLVVMVNTDTSESKYSNKDQYIDDYLLLNNGDFLLLNNGDYLALNV